jgi:hypothetical protein
MPLMEVILRSWQKINDDEEKLCLLMCVKLFRGKILLAETKGNFPKEDINR